MTRIKGRNEHDDVGSRTNVPRRNVVAEIERGEHSDADVVRVDGREYARDNPDSSTADTVNRDK